MIRNKYLGVLAGTIILVANLPGCGAGAAHRATSNPDGSRFTDEQILERELRRGGYGDRWSRKRIRQIADEATHVFPKKYVVAYTQIEGQKIDREDVGIKTFAGVNAGDALDYLNVGLHLAGSGTVLGPLWLSIFDGSDSGVKKSLERSSASEVQQQFFAVFQIHRNVGDAPGSDSFGNELEDSFIELDSLLRTETPLECEASDHAQGEWAQGRIDPGFMHSRWYFCGLGPGTTIHHRELGHSRVVAQAAGEKSGLAGAVNEGDLYAYLVIGRLGEIDGWQDPQAAQQLYRQIRDQLDPNWYTVFTGPDAAGDWKVFVAKGDKIMAFDPPPKS